MELPQELASRLDSIWEEYIGSLDDKVWDTDSASRNLIPEAGIDDALKIASDAHYDAKDLDGRPVILHPLSVGMARTNDLHHNLARGRAGGQAQAGKEAH